MLRSYLIIAFRTLLKHKQVAFINICGLAVSMVRCVLIMLYVSHELSLDNHHQNPVKSLRTE